jgi:membrane-associated protease RseP (regulator of RpoE activity)
MFNLDMIGRLGDDKTLKINGTGTSPTWDAFFRKFRCYDFRYQFSKGGRGPSDHTSFYNQNIPVLHFFTGLHADYHKPTDVAAKINFQGVREIVALCATLVEELNTMDSPPLFTPTDDAEESRPLRFNVTMGIMPGYNNDDSGLEVEGVTKGKPAEKAGITKGDIIVKIGERQIRNIRDYMEALSLYDKGDSTPVQIIRSGKQLEVTVHFE